MRERYLQTGSLIAHLVAGGLALTYAWVLSGTALQTTGLQFVMPLVVILLVHLGFMGVGSGLRPGFSLVLYRRSFVTAALIVVVLVGGSIFAPQPAQAIGFGDVLEFASVVVLCAAMIAIVVGIGALALYLVGKLFAGLKRLVAKGGGPDNRMHDIGGLAVAFGLLSLASLEGVPGGFAFSAENRVTATYRIAADPDHVWAVMETATSPDFPLPALIAGFARPVAVTTDEGVGLGANRVVQFAGREGEGALHLRVVARSDTRAVFAVLSDSTPYAGWIGHRQLIYEAVPDGDGTLLSVTLAFDRHLAPAWFFGPVMRGATYLAVDVLARDVVARSGGHG